MRKRKIGKAQKRRKRRKQDWAYDKYGRSGKKTSFPPPLDQEANEAMAMLGAMLLTRRRPRKTEEEDEQDKD